MNKKIVIIFFIITIVIACCITVEFPKKEEMVKNKLSLEEVKESLLLTKKIEVEKIPVMTNKMDTYPIIEEEEIIKKIVTLLSKVSLPPENTFYTGAEVDIYNLKLFDENNNLIVTIRIDSLPWEFIGQEYDYTLHTDFDNIKELKDLLKEKCHIYIPEYQY